MYFYIMHVSEAVDNFSKGSSFSEEERSEIVKHARLLKLRRKEIFVAQGEFSSRFAYIIKGLVKHYVTDKNDGQHIISFSAEDYWIADLHACVRKMPSVTTIECLEDCELLVFNYEDLEALFMQIPALESHFRKIMQNRLMSLQVDRFNQISLSAEQRYLLFTANNAHLFQRVSLKDIASFLGIFPESLSRIRRNLSKTNQQ